MKFQHWCTLLVVTVLAGCGSSDGLDFGDVTGTVNLDGKPLPNATVMFQPADGRPSMGTTNEQGQYELKYTRDRMGALSGHHVVNIRTRQEDDSGRVIVKEFLPKRYHDKTELSADVKGGDNTINFDLTSGG